MMASGKLLTVMLAVLALGSLIGAIVLEIWGPVGSSAQAWTAFLAFAGTLLGVHIPAPSDSG